MDTAVVLIFIIVYAGMILGRIPYLALDRAGVALLGAIALLALRKVGTSDLPSAVDIPTMGLLFGLMIVSAQFRVAGFYSNLVRRLTAIQVSPEALLAILIITSGVLSALLANDIVCLAVTPILVESCCRRNLDPKPYLLALACSANIGSAATIIGNPQNMLIGQVLKLDFADYLYQAGIPSALGLAALWVIICVMTRGRWQCEMPPVVTGRQRFSLWQTGKGLFVLILLMIAFLAAPWPRETVALTAAGILLLSRKMSSREIIGLVDWQLLVLFFGLFVVNHAVMQAGLMDSLMRTLADRGIHLETPAWLFGASAVLSNIVSNVPAVMLLLPAATHPMAGPVLALSSTLAGNLLIVGSIANIIVVEQAAQYGVKISWREHARIGVPVTVATLGIAAFWLWIMHL